MTHRAGKVNLFYFASRRNFGDELGPIILKNVCGVDTQLASIANADLLAIGSLLELFLWKDRNLLKFLSSRISTYSRPLHIFGAGFIREPYFFNSFGSPQSEIFIRNVRIHAVRGLLTKERVERIGKGLPRELVVGDPGILASLLIDRAVGGKRYALGIIPHYIDANNELLLRLNQRIPNSVIIDVTSSPFHILDTIAQCDTVLSTAMHGLIVADSFGVPNTWIRVSDKIIGGDYKFKDYYSAYGITDIHCSDLRELNVDLTPQSIADNYQIRQDDVVTMQKNLLNAFPSDLG